VIQACVIVKNEEEILEKCLKSIRGIDIIICDTGSTDKTVEIAKKYGKVYEDYKWEDSFCKARNHALSKVSKDAWVISIDADEELFTPIDKVIEVIEKAEKQGCDAIDVKMVGGNSFVFPRIFKNTGQIEWKGDAHNYLSGIKKKASSDITIRYGYSPTHAKDPDRTLRILKKAVPTGGSREIFYLAREYSYRKDYPLAIAWLDKYIESPGWNQEWAEACFLKATCLWQSQRGEEARDACLQALKINTNFKEAIELMAEMSGPINRKRWLSFAEGADNSQVLFIRTKEKGKEYYDKLFKEQSDFSRYDEIHRMISKWTFKKRVLDIGCGRGDVEKYIKNYRGFDFSEEAIKIAKENGRDCWVGDIYDKKNYKDTDIYLCLEVLEHVDDKRVLDNVSGRIIFSVPSFQDPSHIRTYEKKDLYNLGLKINKVVRFNWHDKWNLEEETENYILLVDAEKV